MMKKFALILALLGLISCNKQKAEITDADVYMYNEYLEYIKTVAGGQPAITKKFGADRNIVYYYKDFPEQNIRFLIFLDKKLNQQYAVFY